MHIQIYRYMYIQELAAQGNPPKRLAHMAKGIKDNITYSCIVPRFPNHYSYPGLFLGTRTILQDDVPVPVPSLHQCVELLD